MQTANSILIIDGNSKTSDIYQSVFKEMGFKIHATDNIQQALDHIQIRNYALVMIKLESLGETDLRQVAWMRSLRRQLPILLMVSKAPRRLVNEFRKAGVSEYLFHPARDKQLSSTIKKLLPNAAYKLA
jgi:DNA-binding NtrC family response regulator